jgi:uncharacterized protein (UPF0303 family)
VALDSDIAALKIQEQRLVFDRLDEDTAWALGSQMRERALARKLPLVLDIRVSAKPLFYVALPGTTPENPDWVRRKVNTVYRFEACSYRIALEYKQRGASFDPARGIDPMNFAAAGGGFPIRVGGLVVGAVTVSGVPQRDDHDFVAESLAAFLKVTYSEIQLPPESA